jgi:hypothetical protein
LATAKQQFSQKFPLLRYPLDAQYPTLNPDNYDLWKEPKDFGIVRSEIVAVTAREAKQMLTHANPANVVRRKQSQVNNIRCWIGEGIYALMDTVEFDWDGTLQNGHHRLEAISLSDGIVLLNVVYGVNPENYTKYDDNYKRTASNILGIGLELAKGEADDIASASKWTVIYWSGTEALESRQGVHGRKRIEAIKAKPEIIQHNQDFDAMVERTEADLPCPKSILLTLLTLGCEVANAKTITRDFIKDVVTGEGLRSGDAAYEYRAFLLKTKDTKKKRVYGSIKLALGLISLRAAIQGEKLDPLRLNSYNPKNGVPRLSAQQDIFFEELAEEARERAKNKLLTKLNTTNKWATPLADFDFFGKRTLTALAKNEVTTYGDLALVNNDVMLRRMLKSIAFDEVKDFAMAMELPTVKS